MVLQEFDKKKTMKFKRKSAGNKVELESIQQPEIKENKVKTSAKKVVYISKRGSKAIFDSINLCSKIFGKDPSTVKYRIEHPNSKSAFHYDWLDGGRLEYLNN